MAKVEPYSGWLNAAHFPKAAKVLPATIEISKLSATAGSLSAYSEFAQYARSDRHFLFSRAQKLVHKPQRQQTLSAVLQLS
jgi:hypothetical protein